MVCRPHNKTAQRRSVEGTIRTNNRNKAHSNDKRSNNHSSGTKADSNPHKTVKDKTPPGSNSRRIKIPKMEMAKEELLRPRLRSNARSSKADEVNKRNHHNKARKAKVEEVKIASN